MKKLKFIMNKGLPASGKTTWALEYVRANSNTVRVNNDEIQKQLFCVSFSKAKDASSILRSARNSIIDIAMDHEHNIVVDNTNLNPALEQEYRELVDLHNSLSTTSKYEFILKDFTKVPIGECLKRNRLRADPVPDKVIYDMYDKFLKKHNPVVLAQNESLPKAIIVDLDGTLALMGDRNPYEQKKVYGDTVNPGVYAIVSAFLHNPNCHVIFVTGREEYSRSETVRWLTDLCKFSPDQYDLYMKEDNDSRPDIETKLEVYNKEIRDKYHVLFCLDDRWRVTQMWRELGLTCLQVEDGFY